MRKSHIPGIRAVSCIDFPVPAPLSGDIAEPLKAAGRYTDDFWKIEIPVHERIKDTGSKDTPHGPSLEYEDGSPVGIFIFLNQMYHISL